MDTWSVKYLCKIQVQAFRIKFLRPSLTELKKKTVTESQNYLEDWNAVRDTCKHNFQYQTRNDMSILANSSQWRTTWKVNHILSASTSSSNVILVFKDVVGFPEINIKCEVQHESGRENICLNTSHWNISVRIRILTVSPRLRRSETLKFK